MKDEIFGEKDDPRLSGIANGNKTILIELSTVVPEFLVVGTRRIRLLHKSQPRRCFKCQEVGHFQGDCPKNLHTNGQCPEDQNGTESGFNLIDNDKWTGNLQEDVELETSSTPEIVTTKGSVNKQANNGKQKNLKEKSSTNPKMTKEKSSESFVRTMMTRSGKSAHQDDSFRGVRKSQRPQPVSDDPPDEKDGNLDCGSYSQGCEEMKEGCKTQGPMIPLT